MSSTNRRSVRTLAALAVTALAALGLASPSSASPLVDGDAIGSITVHKYERPETPTNLPNNGTEQDVDLEPVADVEFTLQQVNTIDLATNAGWAAASSLSGVFSPADPEGSITGAGYSLGTPSALTTGASGEITFSGLPVGLYLITETDYPAGVTPSAPFLVSVPLTDPDNNDAWLYDVHVYPKNSIDTIEKTVQDASGVKLGDEIQFTILGDIPNEAVITGYKIVDRLDTKLDYLRTAVTLEDGTPLAASDYEVQFDAATNTVTVLFSEAGRAVLAANNSTRVQVVITTAVNTVGEIENSATLYPNGPSFDWQPGDPGEPPVTPPVVTKWGELTLLKVDENGDALAGAAFSVYASEADALAGTNPIVLDGETVFEVDANGELTISGLRYSGWADGAEVLPGDAKYRTYYLVEVRAPEGYELLAQPIDFIIDAATTQVGVDLEIENVPSNGGFELPLTGGVGTTVIYLAGALIAAGAVVIAIRSRRQGAQR